MTEKEANQRLVNEAHAHLHKTGKQSTVDGSCCYNGSGCAMYPIFVDDDARDESEGAAASAVIAETPHFIRPWARHAGFVFADDLQRCHDEWTYYCEDGDSGELVDKNGYTFLEFFDKRLQALCKEYELVMPEPVG